MAIQGFSLGENVPDHRRRNQTVVVEVLFPQQLALSTVNPPPLKIRCISVKGCIPASLVSRLRK